MSNYVDLASMERVQSAKKKALEATTSAHKIFKSKFAAKTDFDNIDHKNCHIRTDELSQNALTAVFLTLRNESWHEFPCSMKFVWIATILVGSGVQWTTTWLLFFYFQKVRTTMISAIDDGLVIDQDTVTKVFSGMMSCALLFAFVLGEIQKSVSTLRHYWAILEVSFLEYWLLTMFICDVSLHLSITCLSAIAIGEQDNITDQLGISLAFFFILEFDEWLYIAFLKEFDVLEDDDFILKSVDEWQTDQQEFYWRKTKTAIRWGVVSNIGLLSVVIYYMFILSD